MKKIIMLLVFVLATILITSQAQAFFGCASDKFATISKEGSETLRLLICGFTPNGNITNVLKANNLDIIDGELKPISGTFNSREINGKYEAYAGDKPFSNAISALTVIVNQKEIPGSEYYNDATSRLHAERMLNLLNTFGQMLIEDKNAEINYVSGELVLDQNGIITKGEIEVPSRKSNRHANIMLAGSLIGSFVRSVGSERFSHPLPQPEFKISGIKLVFSKERKINFFEDKSNNNFFANYDPTGKIQEDLITGDKGAYALFIPEDKKIKPGRGKTYRNGEEIKGDLVLAMFPERPETLLCCSTIVEYCIPADSRLYPWKSLGTDCSLGLGNKFNADKEKVTGEFTTIANVKVLTTKEQIKELLA